MNIDYKLQSTFISFVLQGSKNSLMRKRSSSNKRLPFMKSREDESSEGDSNSLANENDQVSWGARKLKTVVSCKIFEHSALQVDPVIEFIELGSTPFKRRRHFGAKTS